MSQAPKPMPSFALQPRDIAIYLPQPEHTAYQLLDGIGEPRLTVSQVSTRLALSPGRVRSIAARAQHIVALAFAAAGLDPRRVLPLDPESGEELDVAALGPGHSDSARSGLNALAYAAAQPLQMPRAVVAS